jgi:photosystem II stability/assembly factor-like uncharacterized protein
MSIISNPSAGDFAVVLSRHRRIMIAAMLVAWVACAALQASAQCWVDQRSGIRSLLTSVSFADSRHGVAAGNPFTLCTNNGGLSWQKCTTPSILQLVRMADTLVAYGTTTTYGEIHKSTDGGLSWHYLAKPVGALWSDCVFRGSKRGMVAGSTYTGTAILIKTTDGGSHWEVHSFDSLSNITSLFAIDSSTVFAAADSVILKTTDWGSTWESIHKFNEVVSSVAFADSMYGSAIGSSLYLTYDGGKHWGSRPYLDSLTSWSVAMPDQGRIILTGLHYVLPYGGKILTSTDEGTTWSEQTSSQFIYESCFPDSGNGFCVGDSGMILTTSETGCPYPSGPGVAPPDGYASAGLSGGSATLSWNYPYPVGLKAFRLRVGVSPSFRPALLDTIIPVTSEKLVHSCVVPGLIPGALYYWTLNWYLLDGSVHTAGTWHFETGTGAISGTAYEDLDRNRSRDPGEPGLAGLQVTLGGSSSQVVATDSAGIFRFSGLDSGTYTVHVTPPPENVFSAPPGGILSVSLGLNAVADTCMAGMYFPWNSMEGHVFEDLNENGIMDSADNGLTGFRLRLAGADTGSFTTGQSGAYGFLRCGLGLDTVSLTLPDGWEQVVPVYPSDYRASFGSLDIHRVGLNFALRRRPHDRVRITLLFRDSVASPVQILNFGVRSRATRGIFGIDPLCTNIDFAEGEFELPPPDPLFFDARFVGSYGSFGEGSWTDIRGFFTGAQVDTYRVAFLPGRLEGGGYPVIFQWDSLAISAAYAGPVEMLVPYHDRVDMKASGRATISDTLVTAVSIIAQSPLPGAAGGIVRAGSRIPDTFVLEQNYPNPFNSSTVIRFGLPAASRVRMVITTVLGQVAAMPVDGFCSAGVHQVDWSPAGLGSGVYYCRMQIQPLDRQLPPSSIVRRMLFLK